MVRSINLGIGMQVQTLPPWIFFSKSHRLKRAKARQQIILQAGLQSANTDAEPTLRARLKQEPMPNKRNIIVHLNYP